MPTSTAKRRLTMLIGCIAGWGFLFLAVGFPIFHLQFKVPVATIASYVGICCVVQIVVFEWLFYARTMTQDPEDSIFHRKVATTVLVATISMLFFYYLRRGRPDPATREFSSIGMAVSFVFALLYSTISIFLRRKPSEMDTMSITQMKIRLVYSGFILSWFCFLFMVYKMNLPRHDVSAWVFLLFCALSAVAIATGLRLRGRLFKLSAEALPHDARKASQFWRGANFISFCCAINPTIYGVVMKILGSSWLASGVLFGLGLGFLLLWRPRPLAVSGVQPA